MYKSLIELVNSFTPMTAQRYDDAIMTEILTKADVIVDKEELMKALQYDRNLLTITMFAAPNGYSAEDCYKAINDTCDRHIKEIRNLPAADVRPVVLCRDCKHKGWVQEPEHGKSVDYCRLLERCVDKQFFCAAGERKTNCGADMR